MTPPTPSEVHTEVATLHSLAQELAVASLSVDAAAALLDQGKAERARRCLDAASAALERAAAWTERRQAEEASACPTPGR